VRRPRTGSTFKRVKGKSVTWWARLAFTDETGKRRDLQRRAKSKAHAEELREQLVKDFDSGGIRLMEAERMTVLKLAEFCKTNYFQPATYDVDGRKTSGIRGVDSARSAILPLEKHFGNMKLRDITVEHLRAYRALRLTGKTRNKTVRSIATVNREMSKMRMMLNVAVSNDWLIKSPFTKARAGTLITIADEVQRERIITRDEEMRLLDACRTPTRAHLYALVIAALETGARQGELLTLRWDAVDLSASLLWVTSYKAKTVQRREVYITPRLHVELTKLRNGENMLAAWRPARKEGRERPCIWNH
jgi:integrase